jgi:hypothetical protein
MAGWTPRLRRADPAKTGKNFPASVPLRTAARRSGTGTGSPDRYFSATASSASAAASISASRCFARRETSAPESGVRVTVAPWSSAPKETRSSVSRSATAASASAS